MDYKKELEKLNSNQKEAVFDESDACVVNANVGSGKTTVLISKVIHLHYEKNISYKDMVVLTFTNKAANEIKERLLQLEGSLNTDELQCFGTFHSVALHFLRNLLPIEQLGYSKDFCVIEPEEELDIALQIIHEEKLQIKYKNRLKKRLEQEKMSKYQDDLPKLRELLQSEKIKQNKMSFSDLLLNVSQLLKEVDIAPQWIIIDEVQDSDNMQLDFIDCLKKEDTKIFAVGDPNQVIYSWRGSALSVFYTLKQKYQAKELSLPVNYRSSSSILEAAKCFLQNNSPLTGIREPGNKITIKKQYNSFQEACYLADRIKEIHEEGVPYREIAIFYRLQEQSVIFEDVFAKNNIPYQVSFKKNIRDIPVLNWAIKLLRYSVNEKDITSGVYVLSNKDYGDHITEKTASKLIKESVKDSDIKQNSKANTDNEDNIQLSFQLEFQLEKKEDLLHKMLHFRKEFAAPETPDESKLYEYFNIGSHLHPTSANYQEDKEAFQTLLSIIITYIKEKQLPFLDGLKDFIHSSALYGINILQKDSNDDSDSVKLMTLHASKGLEFSYVFITGVNYGLIPLQGKSFEDEDEERRLFFVGITRAKDYLELSYYTNPDTFRTMPGESRFIQMIPKHLLQRDEIEQAEVNLHDLKRQILAQKNVMKNIDKVSDKGKKKTLPPNKEEIIKMIQVDTKSNLDNQIKDKKIEQVKQVSHTKYGVGTVMKEDETMITVEFEGYGEKEFIKAFSELKDFIS